jgi:hypothetical protein
MLPTKFRFILPSGFREEDFFKIDQSEKNNCMWRPCLLTDLDKCAILIEELP